MISRFGELFGWVELWNEPYNVAQWNWKLEALRREFPSRA